MQELLGERARGTFYRCWCSVPALGRWQWRLMPIISLQIEPQPAICDLLDETISLNELDHKILMVRSAAGRYCWETLVAVLDLEKPSNFGGLSLREPLIDQPNAPTERVSMTSLDQLIGVAASEASHLADQDRRRGQ